MSFETPVWSILEDDEDKRIWKELYNSFKFSPNTDTDIVPFHFKIPVDVYDISSSLIWNNNKEINDRIRFSFIECLKDDDYMYVLDWQHTCFRYNPRIVDDLEYPIFVKYEPPIKSGHVEWEGYNVYFPTYYPDGDYYFFISKDLTWGYLTHPWRKEAYVFGACLRKSFSKFANEIGFIFLP